MNGATLSYSQAEGFNSELYDKYREAIRNGRAPKRANTKNLLIKKTINANEKPISYSEWASWLTKVMNGSTRISVNQKLLPVRL